ncbi:hypothetical protein NEUTE1DRAFT_82509 [Neurospora tetrasperma FGSC 2508]|uniref:Myotubularin phosphatase domain-containing protein n=1 Tax=Neurospora tetrasperma (strain FGSC 2508 / ATCC MYA-4615 / P0657) TaxID=510951 RepID=F8MK63_NEUT8|nr:uncharacterized protein NEUTE1DRAFT_82509 [Neurospora tetrasperma FGSC 2508]EGO58196.1 hypothetical protein NEUTE1DRAFT_82509 [Neurospora tetrasperma FGSC 2508]EGZ71488.1 hypothetical protein NEUTE2DRAFT_110093 [Neurospora tetrasperma FGSC 2509]
MAAPHLKHTFANIHALRGGKPELGDLALSDYHLVFRFPPESLTAADPSLKKSVKQVWFAFHIISQCTLRPTPPSSGVPSSIRIRFRDFTYVSFNFAGDKEAREAFEFIKSRTCKLGSVDKLLAFSYRPPPNSPESKINGWDLYDVRAEFRRQGISEKSRELGWRISTINKDYSFSPTYPALLIVPSKISDATLKYAASYRSRQRIPTLTYRHPVNNCTITRCSQPLPGISFKRNIQDESLVSACFSASTEFAGSTSLDMPVESPPPSTADLMIESENADGSMSDIQKAEDELTVGGTILYDGKTGKRLIYGAQQQNLIVDARPVINSYAMQAIGYGTENMEHYKFAKKEYLNIDNIHVMRESLEKVISAIKDADVSPFPPNKELLAKSKWLKHISGILSGSALIAQRVGIQHSNVLIHCSDGWDRTSQLSALSQLMLDPYYRTLEGFIVLVEKDWLSFGHMFHLRSGHLSHEDWFTVDGDALAGTAVKPGENDGRADHFENAIAGAKRFWSKKTAGGKEAVTDADGTPIETGVEPAVAENMATRPKDISPVFHQFLDATYQLLRQHPTRFEFNERFLRRLYYHVYSCQYGTFLFNNERQRHEARLQERTRSVWAYFLSRRSEFTNEQYDATVDDHVRGRERILFPRCDDVRWWHQLFNRTDDEMNGDLNALAATAERVAAYQQASSSSELSRPVDAGTIDVNSNPSSSGAPSRTSVSPTRSPQPPGLAATAAGGSVLAGVESAHEILTPGTRSPAPPNRNVAAGDPTGTFAALQERVSGLSLGKAMFGGGTGGSTGRSSIGGSGSDSGRNSQNELVEQEMKSMS